MPSTYHKSQTCVKLPPNRSVMNEIKLSDTIVGNGPEPDLTLCQERGVQVAASIIVPSGEETTQVMITNYLSISQRAEVGMQVGTVTPTEVIDTPQSDSKSSLVVCCSNSQSWDPSAV